MRGTTLIGNYIYTDTPNVCLSDVKLTGVNTTMSGNVCRSGGTVISINEWSGNTVISGNELHLASETSAGAIEIDANGLQSWINGKADYWPIPSTVPNKNICITGNTLIADTSYLTDLNAFRIFTESSLPASLTSIATYTVDNLTISGNTVIGFKNFIYQINGLVGNVTITGNNVKGSYGVANTAILQLNGAATAGGYISALQRYSITGNFFEDFNYYLAEIATTSVGYTDPPSITSGNNFKNVNILADSTFKRFDNAYYRFDGNTGSNVTSRDFPINNSLHDGVNAQSIYYNNMSLESTATQRIRFYFNDIGSYTLIATSTP
jgi:hypothetical protein